MHAIQLLRRYGCLLGFVALPALSEAKMLFDFNAKPTFYHFKNSETELAVTVGNESAFAESKSLQAEYKFAGDQSYVGLGVDFKHVASWMAQWDKFGATGGLTFVAKSKEATTLTVQVLVEGGQTYSAVVSLTTDWQRSWLPFSACQDKQGASFDAATMKVAKLVVRPSRKPAANTIWIDEITIEENVAAAKQEKAAPLAAK